MLPGRPQEDGMPHRARHVPHVESGSYPVRQGCAVRPLVDGEPAFRRICEAVESARRSVWVTVAFLEPDFAMPDDHGHLFDVLDRAAVRGIDVRVIFWRSPETPEHAHFPGSEAQRALLRERGARFAARWDALPGDMCHHQKSWLVDAGSADEIAFVGGINLDKGSVSPPGHGRPERRHRVHDVYLELRGPAATDVHHNFVQRWNEASDHERADGHWPEGSDAGHLEFPETVSPAAGDVPVQITRTVQEGRYGNGRPTPDGKPFTIREGEFSIYDQYISAIDAARRTIYLEDQAIGAPKVVGHLKAALERGVEVIFLVPGECHPTYHAARKVPATQPFFDLVAGLDGYPGFTLAAIATNEGPGTYGEVYVHAKIMLVDDAWATIGSTNVADRSFKQDTELNASIWHGEVTRALRHELFEEHLDVDTRALEDVEAFRRFHEHARDNTWRRLAGEPLAGLAYRLDAALYGLGRPARYE
jgi:phosphatidylserine/phosphatidylglycerophosphate/cardiolipin synthase-like enzyme